MRASPSLRSVTAVAAGSVLFAGVLHAQDPAGLEAGATVSFGTRYEDDAWKAYSGLGFTLSSSTRTQGVGLSFGGGVESGDGDTFDFVDPSVLLTYNRVGQNALLGATARYRETDLGDFVIDEDVSTGEIISNSGSKSDLDLSTGLEFGTQSPFGGSVNFGWRQVTYSGAANLADYDIQTAGATLRFSIDPQIDLRTTASYQETLADAPGTDRINRSVGVGADIALSALWNMSVDVGYSSIETRPSGGPAQTDEGPSFQLVAERDMQNGALRFDLSSIVTNAGDRTEAQVTRSLETAQGDGILLSAGFSHGGNGDVKGIFGLDYTRSGPSSEIAFSLEQAVRSDVFGQERLQTRFRVAHEYTLSETANLQSAVSYRETDFLNSTAQTARKMDVRFGYGHELTRDLDLLAEVSHTRSWTGTNGPSIDNTVFLGVERAFNWRP